jgi:tRNA A22 N-methylase
MCCQATCEQQEKILEESCKVKPVIKQKRKKQKRKVSSKTGSIGDKLLEETHPDPREHQAGFLPDISENIQESNKDLAIQMSCEKVLTTK